jgi:hypothetical protein
MSIYTIIYPGCPFLARNVQFSGQDIRAKAGIERSGEMGKTEMAYIGIALLIVGLILWANTAMQAIENECRWIENICRVM